MGNTTKIARTNCDKTNIRKHQTGYHYKRTQEICRRIPRLHVNYGQFYF